MKIKNFNKKLTLNKQTLSNLDSSSMQKLRGGTGGFTEEGWNTYQTIEKICYIYSCVNCTWRPLCGDTFDC